MVDYCSLLAKAHCKTASIGSRFGFVEPVSLSRFHSVDFAKGRVLFPVLDRAHWTLIRVCMTERTFVFRVTLFDGLGMAPSAFTRIQDLFTQYFVECSTNPEFRRRSRTKWNDPEQWRLMASQASFHKTEAEIPRQSDDSTCGFRALHYMEWLLLRPSSWASDTFEHGNDEEYWDLYRHWVLYALFVDGGNK